MLKFLVSVKELDGHEGVGFFDTSRTTLVQALDLIDDYDTN